MLGIGALGRMMPPTLGSTRRDLDGGVLPLLPAPATLLPYLAEREAARQALQGRTAPGRPVALAARGIIATGWEVIARAGIYVARLRTTELTGTSPAGYCARSNATSSTTPVALDVPAAS